MPDSKISDLTAVTVPALTDLLPAVQTPGAGPKKITISQIQTLIALSGAATKQVSGANYTTTSGTFADVDATNLSSTITTGAHRVKVTLTGLMDQSSTSNVIQFDIAIDGTRQGDTTNGSWQFRPNANGAVVITYVFTSIALSAGSHTIKLQWKVNGNTGTLYRNAAIPLDWTVEELGF